MSVLLGVVIAIIASTLPHSDHTSPDACSLLTKEIATAALGEAVTGPKAIAEMKDGAGNTVSACEYTGSGYHRVQVNLTRMSKQMVPMMFREKASTDLAGMGDVACWYNEKHAEVHGFKGDAFVSVELKRDGDPTEAIKGVLKKALDGLK
jgi:hypothetical protein